MKKQKREGYLEKIVEYQDKMYIPGFYTGGNLNPIFSNKGKKLGILFLGIGIVLSFFAVLNFIFSEQLRVDDTLLYSSMMGFVGTIFLIAGIRVWRRS